MIRDVWAFGPHVARVGVMPSCETKMGMSGLLKLIRRVKMKQFTKLVQSFVRSEDGLVTVEWVALAAGLVVGAVVIGILVLDNVGAVAKTIPSGVDTAVTTALGKATNLKDYQ